MDCLYGNCAERPALGVQLTSLDIVSAGSMVALCGKILERIVDAQA